MTVIHLALRGARIEKSRSLPDRHSRWCSGKWERGHRGEGVSRYKGPKVDSENRLLAPYRGYISHIVGRIAELKSSLAESRWPTESEPNYPVCGSCPGALIRGC